MTASFDYSGKTVVVIGGTSGINLAIAKGFAAAGAKLAVASRKQEKVDAAVAALQALGAVAQGQAFDVRDNDGVEAGLAAFHRALGDFDVLVSGAAGNFPATAVGMSPNAFRSVMEIDLLGSFQVARAAHAHLKKPGGSLIHISAPQAFLPAELQSHVCAAKAGVDMLTRVLAMEWGRDGLRVNSIVPGPIAGTEGMARLAPTPQIEQAVIRSVPLGRFGEGEDIARTALWLGAPEAGFVSGAVIPVDGGWSLGGYGEVMSGLSALFAKQQGAS